MLACAQRKPTLSLVFMLAKLTGNINRPGLRASGMVQGAPRLPCAARRIGVAMNVKFQDFLGYNLVF
jgi:hypothetical protein